jgi:hypothetical protein
MIPTSPQTSVLVFMAAPGLSADTPTPFVSADRREDFSRWRAGFGGSSPTGAGFGAALARLAQG